MTRPKVAVIGLAVMGSNLARNIARNGFSVAVYNRSGEVTRKFIQGFGSAGQFSSAATLQELVSGMDSPRQIILMIKAGPAIDAVLSDLLPLLAPGDIIIDGGNSYYTDTERRQALSQTSGIHFLGVGISGGEEGALNGPSIMPGGERAAWQVIAPMLEKISAKAPHPCTAYIGPGGSGHFVKMVHNGIEYGDMQLIAEVYHCLTTLKGLTPDKLASLFSAWNEGVLNSFLIEITAAIFKKRDGDTSNFLVDQIRDSASQKGTGIWTAQVALDLGASTPTLSGAVDARLLSSLLEQRKSGSQLYSGTKAKVVPSSNASLTDQQFHDALYAAKIITYAQGMSVLAQASNRWNWNLNLSEIAKLWQGGCIIRAKFLSDIAETFSGDKQLPNLLLAPFIKDELARTVPGLRTIVSQAALAGVPTLALGSSLSYFDSYTSARLPQNLTQAQRDLFGAHTYERLDRAGSFHTEW